jgi:predicted O-methyltransferase YrrM
MTEKSAKPYSKLNIATAYFRYRFKSLTKHGVHSPKVFEFMEEVLDSTSKSRNRKIERERKRLKESKQVIDFTDFGKSGNLFKKNVSDIARNSLKPKKYARLIAQTVNYYEAANVLELGTSLGITTAYIAQNENVKVHSLEGDPTVANIANSIWKHLGYKNITTTIGDFNATLGSLGDKTYDIIYIDGNHRLEPTLRYFEQLQRHANEKTLFIFDDIHYSPQMEKAWETIQANDSVTITIDLFFLGYVFIDKTLPKQNFTLRY